MAADVVVAAGDNGKLWDNTTATPYKLTPLAGVAQVKARQSSSGLVSIVSAQENLLTDSEDMTTANWTRSNATAAITTAVSPPAGYTTVNVLTKTGSNGYVAHNTTSVNARQTFTLRMQVRGVGSSIGRRINLFNYNNAGNAQVRGITLTGAWQEVSLTFTPNTTAQNGLSINLQDGYGANVLTNEQVYVTGAQLSVGEGAQYVATTASAVNRAYTVIGPKATLAPGDTLTVTESTSGVFLTTLDSERVQTNGTGFLLVRSGRQKGESIIIAPADAYRPYDADFICNGSSDAAAISEAIWSLRGIGGTVKVKAGTLLLWQSIIHDADWVKLEAEGRPFWGNASSYWPTLATEGAVGGTKLKLMTPNIAAIKVGNQYQQANRHQGIAIKGFYFYGAGSTGYGVHDTGKADISEVTDCAFHNMGQCLDLQWDAPLISGNSFQSSFGDAVTLRFVGGLVTKNVFWDMGGSGLVLAGTNGGCQVTNNGFGSLTNSAIRVNSPMNTIAGNGIQGMISGACVEISGANAHTNVVSGNVLSPQMVSGNTAMPANPSGHGVYVRDGATNVSITGNAFNNGVASPAGYAVALGNNNGTDTSAQGCAVVGNTIRGNGWADANVRIIDRSGGSTNKISLNVGDSR